MSTRPEIELLLCCARTQPEAAQVARAGELLRGTIDWDSLRRAAIRHGLLPLLYRLLSGSLAELVPAQRLQDLRRLFQQNAARNLYQTGELCRLLRLFAANGIEAIPYKGPALAVCAYGDVALRQFVDLDVLVRRRDVQRASALLAADGYEPHFRLDADAERAFMRLSYVQLFTRDAGQRAVELHWAIAPRFFSFPLRTDALWERAETVSLGRMRALAPAPDDLLLLLAVHGAKDLWERLEWVAGLAEIIRRRGADIDWPRLTRRAEGLGAARMLRLALALARTLLDAPLPADVQGWLAADAAVEALRLEVCARLFAFETTRQSVRSTASFHLRARERARDRVRYCALLALTTTPVDWATVRLPRPLGFVYYVLRPFRLMKKYVLHPREGTIKS